MFKMSLLLALRSRFSALSIVLGLGLVLVVICAAEFSGRQPATVALDVGISFVRFVLPVMAVLLSQELIFREIERRYYLCSLAFPASRGFFLVSRISAIYFLMLVLLALMAALLALVVQWIALGYEQSTPVAFGLKYCVVMLFVALDVLVVVSLAVLLSVYAASSGFILLGCIGLVLVGRSYSSVIDMLSSNSSLVGNADAYQSGLGVLGYLLPNLGWLDIRGVALYGRWELLPVDWLGGFLGVSMYAVALFCVAVFGLQRKRFA